MNREALNAALDYIEDENVSAQITYEPKKREFTVDFKMRIHAEICQGELKDQGFYRIQTLLTGHHMRVE